MSAPINMNNLAAQTDFSSIGSAQLKSLLDSKASGRFTLDAQGKLATIDVPAQRDGAFVRFFKGLFSAEYKERQNQLDCQSVLEKNAAFTQQIMDSFKNIQTPGSALDALKQSAHDETTKIMTDKMLQRHQTLTLDTLREVTSTTSETSKGMLNLVRPSVELAFGSAERRTFLGELLPSPKPIKMGDNEITLDEFMQKHNPQTSIVTSSKSTAGWNKFEAAVTGLTIALMQGKSLEGKQTLFSSREQIYLTNVLGQPKRGSDAQYNNFVKEKLANLSTNLATELSTFASSLLGSGMDPKDVALNVDNQLDKLRSFTNMSDMFKQMTPEELQIAKNSDSSSSETLGIDNEQPSMDVENHYPEAQPVLNDQGNDSAAPLNDAPLFESAAPILDKSSSN